MLFIQNMAILIKDFLVFGNRMCCPTFLQTSFFLTFACFLSLTLQFCLLYGTKLVFQERGWYLEHKYLTPKASVQIRSQVRGSVQRRHSARAQQQPSALGFLRKCPFHSVASF